MLMLRGAGWKSQQPRVNARLNVRVVVQKEKSAPLVGRLVNIAAWLLSSVGDIRLAS